MIGHFLATSDRYSQEQVVEQINRGGLLLSILEAYGEPGRDLETRFAEEMVARGVGEVLLPASQNVPAERLGVLSQELPHTSKIDLFLRQLTSFVSAEQSAREGWFANGSEPAAPVSESAATDEVS